jgi:hypothetical protein
MIPISTPLAPAVQILVALVYHYPNFYVAPGKKVPIYKTAIWPPTLQSQFEPISHIFLQHTFYLVAVFSFAADFPTGFFQ